jgi:hypothetical protein
MHSTPELLLTQLAAHSHRLPLDLDRWLTRIDDLAQEIDAELWRPGCPTTRKVTRCFDIVQEISALLAPLDVPPEIATEKQLLERLVTPTYQLTVSLRELHDDVQGNFSSRLMRTERRQIVAAFGVFENSVPRTGVAMGDIHDCLRACLWLLDTLLLPDIYTWTRFSGYPNIWHIMSVDGHEVSIHMNNGQLQAIVGLRLTRSPKWVMLEEIRELASRISSCQANA